MEFYVMLYLIRTQRHRRVEQIYYDHNNEHLYDEFSPGQLDYRKKEIRIKRVYDKLIYLYTVV